MKLKLRGLYRRLSIRTKLQLISLATTGMALFLASTYLVVHEFDSYRNAMTDNLTAQARIVARNSAAAVVFGDRKTVVEILDSLQASPTIANAEIRLANDQVFASFARHEPSDFRLQIKLADTFERLGLPRQIRVQEAITVKEETVGRLDVIADLGELYATIVRYAAVASGTAAGALILAMLFLRRLQRSITAPLSNLTTLMRMVSSERDYSARAGVDSHDELGDLAHGFNDMLKQIQDREQSLRRELSERRRAEQKLDRLAHFDTVTGLRNRHSFNARLNFALEKASAYGERTGVMFIDLDNFKIINDTLGHHIGDLLLAGVGKRLFAVLRSRDLIFRIGGDEFALLLESVGDRLSAEHVAEKIIDALSRPFSLEEHEIFVSASIGIGFCPDDAQDSSSLLRCADTAMYYAKERGKNTYQFFLPEMNGKALNRLNLENGIRRALEKNEFVLTYQPQFNLRENRIVGVEALVRWKHPELGIINPAEFIPIAEDSGLIIPLGEWILRTACNQAAFWQKQSPRPPVISVNVSGRQFKDDNLVPNVTQIILETGISPRHLELELTESTLMEGSRETLLKLSQIRALGIRLSIDDFGTGYSSMSYLKRFPITQLKIDRSFVDGIPDNKENAAIVRAIIALGRSLDIDLIAEGVETGEQAEFLEREHCPHIQGYYYSRPLSERDMTLLLMKEALGE
ncbi:bifunctional diguanylate cyclase/phosphodiesterase [Methylococcus sp. EFPC2]|uniref:putative bifunctional diguanylate cyclase/phosphodiesterase n=1 Tax=Methylococcus sp. EFPC2 TaxID=2812648 RepID=UPI00196829E6|nr:EAL domain-containing protein [Methylococcus sp. EFPC2]QSA96475.1 EAL domain-containing protein [Methylococcus sp. EFPC2]